MHSTYWRQLLDDYGDLPLDQVRPTMIRVGAQKARDSALRRRGQRDGRSAEEHYVSAARRLFTFALDDG